MSKIRLLTKDELFDNPLNFISAYDKVAKPTDFARLTGCMIVNDCAWYYIEDNGVINVINHDGKRIIDDVSSCYAGIRPVLDVDVIPPVYLDNAEEVIPGAISKIKFGYFPLCSISTDEINIKQLEKDGQKFYFNFASKTCRFLGKHFVYVEDSNNIFPVKVVYLESSSEKNKERYGMIRVAPITWYVDHEKRICISKYVLIGNIYIDNIKNYLENIFLPQIIQFDYCFNIRDEFNLFDDNKNINTSFNDNIPLSFDDMIMEAQKQMDEISGKSYTKKI